VTIPPKRPVERVEIAKMTGNERRVMPKRGLKEETDDTEQKQEVE
jgi:hypothetical protein